MHKVKRGMMDHPDDAERIDPGVQEAGMHSGSPIRVGPLFAKNLDGRIRPEKDATKSGNLADASDAAPPALHRIVEAILFVGGGTLTMEQACAAVPGMSNAEFLHCVDALNRAYRLQGRPYRIRALGKAYELALRAKFLVAIERMHGAAREARLSSAALDVLSLVAYRQPLTKQEIDGMRGAESGGILRQLVRRGLLTIVQAEPEAKAESAYRTTRRFIEFFQLRGLEDLPQTQDLQRL
jgi:segregation and condensation protein B